MPPSPSPRSSKSLVIGIGGGGDVAGALAVARTIAGADDFELGGVAWERFAIDPHPGPRRLEELRGIDRIGESRAALCGPEGSTPDGVRLSEAGAAEHLGRPTVLIDITAGPAGAAAGIASACARLGCSEVVLADVGGDALADGSEPGLASPLCDAVMVAAAGHLPEGLRAHAAIFGAGCDGELTHGEVLQRVAELARAGIWTGTLSPTRAAAEELASLGALVPTEASLIAARSALGELGTATIRSGRRTVEMGPIAALIFLFDARAAIGTAAPLAGLVNGCDSIEASRAALAAAGIRTELDWELERSARG